MSEQSGLEMRYFVLKPAGTSVYAQASRDAMTSYAWKIRDENPAMAKELLDWVDRAANEAQARLLKQHVMGQAEDAGV